MIYRRGQGHPGGALSAAEIVATLFFHYLKIDPKNPEWEERDRFILSKGHSCAILYPALAKLGFFPEDDLFKWGNIGCHLQAHPDRLKTPGIEMSTGLLGHGISIGAGLCLAARIRGLNYRTYVLVGDGECQAGVIWEGAMFAAKYKLSNLCVIVDYNKVQLDGFVHDIMPIEPFKEKWSSFNWAVLEINGHNIREILEALDEAKKINDNPTVIIAHTIKGKGVSFMENKASWHGRAPNEEEYRKAMEELRNV
jgi:transketolase